MKVRQKLRSMALLVATASLLAPIGTPFTAFAHASPAGTVALTGTVTGPGGEFLPGSVAVTATDSTTHEMVSSVPTNGDEGNGNAFRPGSYELDLPPGTYDIAFEPGSKEFYPGTWGEVDYNNVQVTSDTVLNAQLQILSESHILSGNITTWEGVAVPNAWVEISGGIGDVHTTTDAQGHYSVVLPTVPPRGSNYFVSVRSMNRNENERLGLPQSFYYTENDTQSFSMSTDSTGDYRLPPTQPFDVTVKDRNGNPAPEQMVNLFNNFDSTYYEANQMTPPVIYGNTPFVAQENSLEASDASGVAHFNIWKGEDFIDGAGGGICGINFTDKLEVCSSGGMGVSSPYALNEDGSDGQIAKPFGDDPDTEFYDLHGTDNLTLSNQASSSPILSWDSTFNTEIWDYIVRDGKVIDTVFAASAGNQTYTDTAASAGGHTYYVFAALYGGSFGSPTNTVSYSSDSTPPVVGTLSWSANPVQVGQNSTLTVLVSDNAPGAITGEYFIGNDPGVGNGVAMPLNSAGTALSASMGADLSDGVYNVGVRAKDAVGNWSGVTNTMLVVTDSNSTIGVSGKNKKDLVPSLANGDILPGLTSSTQTDAADYGMTVQYKNGALDPNNGFNFVYNTGTNCGKKTASNCHSFTLNANSFNWLFVNGTSNSNAQFQGTATVIIDGVTSINPFTIRVTDGDRLNPTSNDYLILKVYATGTDPSTSSPIYQASGSMATRNSVKIL